MIPIRFDYKKPFWKDEQFDLLRLAFELEHPDGSVDEWWYQ